MAAKKLQTAKMKLDLQIKELDRKELEIKSDISAEDVVLLNQHKSDILNIEGKLDNSYVELSLCEGQEKEEIDLSYDNYSKAKRLITTQNVKIEKAILNITDDKNKIQISQSQQSPRNLNVNLPKFELPVFDGTLYSWFSFKQLFLTTIHENSSLTDVQKLQYLQASVTGEAARLIKGFPIIPSNYNAAFETLKNRYDNKRELAYALCNKIFSFKPIKTLTAKALYELLDCCNEAMRNLSTLELQCDTLSEIIVVNFLQKRIGSNLRQQWELTLEDQSFPSYKNFITFLEKQARSLQSSKQSNPSEEIYKPKKSVSYNTLTDDQASKFVTNRNDISKTRSCELCKANHLLFQCQEFINLNFIERSEFVKKCKLCYNCLRNHNVYNCKNQFRCKLCKKKHHTLLHRESSPEPVDTQPQNNSTLDESVSSAVSLSSQNQHNILLSTAIIQVKDANGNLRKCRALVDSASQMSLITFEFAEKLKLKQHSTNMIIRGTGNCKVETNSSVKLTFSNRFNSESFNTQALVVNQLTTNLPNFQIKNRSFPHILDLTLADPDYFISRPIDVIIGADLFVNLILPEKIDGKRGQPYALNSKLGWLLSGRIPAISDLRSEVESYHSNLETILKGFWELENIPGIQNSSVENEEHECDRFFKETVVRDQTGRYTVKLPFKSNSELGDSKNQAIKRFFSLENKFGQNQTFCDQYKEFMQEYLTLGHMEEIPEKEIQKPSSKCYYMPHHGVIRESSSTSRLRVVFDCSCKSSSNISLNDLLHSGPKLQTEIFSVLTRFRNHPIVITADIAKMFRQINVSKEDTDYQRIVWRNSPDQQLKEHRLLTVTYGQASSPYLAIKTLHQLADDEAVNFPEISKIVKTDFYVDDLLTGAPTISRATEIVKEIINLMSRGGFTLRKWLSNEQSVISSLPPELKAKTESIDFHSDFAIKLLGLQWNPQSDCFSIQINPPQTVTTKRQLLSHIARIFDPLGFLSPTTIIAKIMIQELWQSKTSWDEQLPIPIQQKWIKFASQLPQLQNLKIPRYLLKKDMHSENIEIHGFCDASNKAISASLYLRSSANSEITVSLIAAKTRVAPLKKITLPRLELCAALLLSQLYKGVIDSFAIPIAQSYFWTDSQITLEWIKSEPHKWKIFVSNRVSQIQKLTKLEAWQHVPGSNNPSDCGSRGIMPSKLLNHELWWKGPSFLSDPQFTIPTAQKIIVQLPECEAVEALAYVTQVKSFIEIDKYSSYTKLIRITAWCNRFINNCRSVTSSRKKGYLSSSELNIALLKIIKQLQEAEFGSEIKSLQTKGTIPSNSKYLSLSLFLDEKDILRVGGRLRNASLPMETKHPILLHKQSHLTELLINFYHQKSLHAGTQVVLSLIREKFWIPSGRDTVRKTLLKCLTCLRSRAKPLTQLLGNLPKERVTMAKAFTKVGLDFAGPFLMKPMLKRSKVKFKSYIALFICFTTKAVHLEVVSELSTDAFIACLRRFMARRSKPAEIYSDNATNFKGASNYMKQQIQICKSETVQNFVSEEAITWHFIPPSAPHFGGLWESNIKSMKSHLLKTCKSAILNFEQLTTLVTQIEACLNSRPLTQLSTDPNDLQPLTPGHFLVGSSLLSFPEITAESLSVSAKWKLIQVLREKFWRRWSSEYLTQLQERSKWRKATENIRPNQLVLLKEDNQPPLKWNLGRITKVYPGDDGLIRVVEVKTMKGHFKRPVVKIVPLPILISKNPGPGSSRRGEDEEDAVLCK